MFPGLQHLPQTSRCLPSSFSILSFFSGPSTGFLTFQIQLKKSHESVLVNKRKKGIILFSYSRFCFCAYADGWFLRAIGVVRINILISLLVNIAAPKKCNAYFVR
ncbi:hypothetical protein FQZ97_1175400 [compost metagenome]